MMDGSLCRWRDDPYAMRILSRAGKDPSMGGPIHGSDPWRMDPYAGGGSDVLLHRGSFHGGSDPYAGMP